MPSKARNNLLASASYVHTYKFKCKVWFKKKNAVVWDVKYYCVK